MAYYFAVEESKKSYVALNIKMMENDENTAKKDPSLYECTLEEIDKFTSQYSDEEKMREVLYRNKVIQWCYYKSKFSVIYKNQDELREVNGNFLYADSRKYIEDYNLVIEYIINKVKSKDTMFLDNLSFVVRDDRLTVYMLTSIALTINPGDKKFDTIIRNFTQSLIQECYLNGNKELMFSKQIKYEKILKIIAFISLYEKELEKDKPYTRTKKPQ